VSAYADLSVAKVFCGPARNDRHDALVVADMRFVHAWHGHMGNLVGNNAKQVPRNSGGMKKHYALFEMGHAFTQFLVRGALDFDRPPHAIDFEAHRGRAFLALARGCGGLFHLSL
jgi:hypothetical protein